MKPTRRNRGFTLVEVMTVVGIIAVLSTLAYAALEVLPQRTRLTGSALELSSAISAARSHAYGRNQRVVVLLNASTVAANDPIRYWVVVDSWSNMGDTLKALPDWQSLADLVPVAPAPPGAQYQVFDNGRFSSSVRLVQDGFKAAVGGVPAAGCGTGGVSAKIGLAKGPTVGSGSFPPPYCFVPSDRACTFCTGDGVGPSVRGAIFFEPDGSVLFVGADGKPVTDGAASITMTPSRDGDKKAAQAIVITNTGLVRTFSASR